MSHFGRLFPLLAQQQTGAQASANGKYQIKHGSSWGEQM
jgi:hypothetical protein